MKRAHTRAHVSINRGEKAGRPVKEETNAPTLQLLLLSNRVTHNHQLAHKLLGC